MIKKTTLQEVQEKITELKNTKASQLFEIQTKQAEAKTQLEAAELAIKDATERMDLDAYEEARQAKRKAQTAIDMYSGRYKQIKQQEYISEAESDKVIDSLLTYEDTLAEEFKAEASRLVKELKKLHDEYIKAVSETEQTISTWENTIRANHRTFGVTMYMDKSTGKHTDRSPAPVPVHRTPYTGCAEASAMGDYIKKSAGLIALYGE